MKRKRLIIWAKRSAAIALAGTLLAGTVTPVGAVANYATESEEKVDAQEAVTSDAASIQFSDRHIVSDLTLPAKGSMGSSITWETTNESVISSEGKVTRPQKGEADVEVILKGTIKMGEYVKKRNFSFLVLAESEFGMTEQFELDEVEILDDYYLSAQNSDIAFLKKFDNDRLLSRFRETAGLDTNDSKPYGGWEDSLLGGHCVGHYLTAVAQAVKVTNDKQLKEKLDTLIDELGKCQDKLGTGFLFGAKIEDKTNVEKQFDILEGEEKGNTWVPWYNMHKVLSGLIDTYKYTGNEKALSIAKKLGDWIYNRVSKWDSDVNRKVLWTEYGGMNDCLYELYYYSRDAKHLTAAHKFDEPSLYSTIAEGKKNCLNGKHANTLIPKFLGAIKRYVVLKETGELTEDDKYYLENAEKFFDIAVKRHSYITGGVSVMEHFREDEQQDGTRTQTNCESCCAHNMLKMAKELFKLTGKKKYADYYETTLRNSIMSAVKADTGATAYFIPMATGYYKTFGKENPAQNMFWCCTGSGMENFTKLADSIYFRTNDTLIVNQYVASKVTWQEKNLVVTQQSDVTKSEKASFTLHAKEGDSISPMELALRVPDWMHKSATVTVNGTEEKDVVSSGGYIVLKRDWKDGDVITIEYPMAVDAFGLPDNNTVYAFRYGPTVLAAKLGTEKMTSTTWAGANLTAPLYKVVGNQSISSTIKYGDSKASTPLDNETIKIEEDLSTVEYIDQINDYLVKDTSSDSLAFKLNGTNADTTFTDGLQFVPFNQLNDERYGIYWYFESKYSESDESLLLSKKENSRLDASILDSTQPGYGQYEKDAIHQMQEEDSVAGTIQDGGSTRYAKAGGYFTYQMIANPEKESSIVCRFAKADNGKTLKVSIGNTVIAERTLSYVGKEDFYDERISIPVETLKENVKTFIPEGDTTEYTVVPVRFESASETEDSARLVGALYMAQDYSKQAFIQELTSSVGEISESNGTYTIVVPKGTTQIKLQYTIADKYGLLYVNDSLVDDTKEQTYDFSDTPLTLNIKVYAEDHVTAKDYTIVIKNPEEIQQQVPMPTSTPQATPEPAKDQTTIVEEKQSKKEDEKPSLRIVGKSVVKKGKAITLTVKKNNIKGKAKWTINKKKLAVLKKKSATKVVLQARKKGKVKVTVKVGKWKKTKKITIK